MAGVSASKARAASRRHLHRASLDAIQAPPGSVPAKPEAASGGPARRGPRYLPPRKLTAIGDKEHKGHRETTSGPRQFFVPFVATAFFVSLRGVKLVHSI